MTSDSPPAGPQLPRAAEVREVLGFVPLVEAYFRRGPGEMPDELAEIFAAHRLTARHGAVLPQLAAGGTLGVSDLAARMGVSLSTVSELVGTLSRAGLVDRREDPDNRRRTLVSLAEQHRAAVEGFVAVRAAPLLRVLDTLSPRDRQGFVAGLVAWASEVQRT
ncbi:MarR family winged helix-turn-helix transcriptional regulator [Actinomadura violacea]|uniref:MarR family transcriptional regulator n=1 Tax=Actinomadura violacea TaxID=2819934 RepID=A0ABS3RHS2_9ACTN|nr:MarR family transcriptional regulator [Actinomadura violacea]MBO2456275.1 MarR family transcriptional regulator [Actinomadura violacea]